MSAELVIRLTKMILVLTEQELLTCLQARPEIFTDALKRGKRQKRYETELGRRPKG